MLKEILAATILVTSVYTPAPAFSQQRAPVVDDLEQSEELPRRVRPRGEGGREVAPERRGNEQDGRRELKQDRRGEEGQRRRQRQPDNTPSASQIERSLDAAPRRRFAPQERVTVREFKRRPDLRRMAPSIEIQSINFDFGSARIPGDQYDKVERISEGMRRVLRRNPDAVFLIEGHTDAVGSFGSNQALSEDRAESLRNVLVREFRVSGRALETVGYGEEFLLVNTQYEEWRNRRVTLRRIDEIVRR